MERSAEERTKYPDRINLDRRGLHGIPVLADEPGLRLLRCFFLEISQLLRFLVSIILHPFPSFQHNFIKRIHNLEMTSRLVFLDLYHNRWKTTFYKCQIMHNPIVHANTKTSKTGERQPSYKCSQPEISHADTKTSDVIGWTILPGWNPWST